MMTGRRGFLQQAGGAAVGAGVALHAGGATAAASPIIVQTERHRIRARLLVSGLANPWGLEFPASNEILVTERLGRLRRVRNGVLEPTPLAGLPAIHVQSQGGLLDLALHPNFSSNRLLYFTFSTGSTSASSTALARARLGATRLENVRVLFRSQPPAASGAHYGSRIAFDGRGFVFVSVGDRGTSSRAQRLDEHNGKIVRLRDDGSVPPDNPFVDRAGAKPEIWALGVRNPQGLALQPGTGRLWETEHGPRGGDELNIIQRGRNYGWPVITYGRNYDGTPINGGLTTREGMEQPVRYWTPSIAPSGMSFYRGSLFPRWYDNIFVAALAHQLIVRLELDATRTRVVREERLLANRLGRVRHVKPGPDGRLYVLTDHGNGGLWVIEPAP